MEMIIPTTPLRLFGPTDMDILICGEQTVDVQFMKDHMDYGSYSSTDATILLFWRVFEEFTHEERILYVRFVSGLTRLPQEGSLPRRFKIDRLNARNLDESLPQASTCFFLCKLPPYQTLEQMRSKLLYAIQNCRDIDTD
eukprot:TRINITY_DN5163_c0_g1_i1.p1 TRINITY_DN5163_c0_g1~~TRINITY_DN5163_c0_g1_i1.p1  ORF type:complete len:140 (-),score=32.97 TRINITY_DN5163_c0_g1_i1:151-570(-)